jgi:hypothetical protein
VTATGACAEQWFLATVTVVFTARTGHDVDPVEVAEALIREPAVIAVRAGGTGDETFYRADIAAASAAAARAAAPEPASSVARSLGLVRPVVRAVAVTDDPEAVPEGFARMLERRKVGAQ